MNGGTHDPDIRWRQRLQSFRKALGQLRNAVAIVNQRQLSELETQGLIQAFEFTHELAWKTLKDYLEDRGEVGIYGSKDATRKAFAVGLIEDQEAWMEMIQSRNRSTHTYNENTAREIAAAVSARYFAAFEKFERAILFGSRAKGNFKPGSDIDLALVGAKVDGRTLNRIHEEIDDSVVPYGMSLLILDQTTDAAVRSHIERVGFLFYERNPASVKA